MSDFPYVAPPVDGLRLAMQEARGRRYRTAGLSSATVGTALVAVLAVLGGSGTQSLVEQPAPEQPAISQLVPGPAGDQTSRQNTVGAVTSPGTVAAAMLGSGPGTGTGTGQGTPDGSSGSGPARDVRPARTTGPMTRNAGSPPLTDVCPVDKTASGTTSLCPTGNYSQVFDSQSRVVGFDLITSVCSYDARSVTLHFEQTVEADAAILDSKGNEVWRWSREHPPTTSPHVLSMTTGDCWEWRTAWNEVDQAGHKVPSGNYTLRVTSFARELGKQNVSEVGITV